MLKSDVHSHQSFEGKEIICFPFNGNAREAVSMMISENSEQWHPLGFLDDSKDKAASSFSSLGVLGDRFGWQLYPQALVLAVPGRPENFRQRKEMICGTGIPASRFSRVISQNCHIGCNVQIGYNTLIMPGVVITGDVSIGNHVVVLPNTVLSHDVIIGDFTMIGSNVSVSGGVNIGHNCYVGSGTRIISEIEIGDLSLLGIGSTLLESMPLGSVYAGSPARSIRQTNE